MLQKAIQFLSTPSARRATCAPCDGYNKECEISIHALREEGDFCVVRANFVFAISIHALREEGDPAPGMTASSIKNFYPRPPRGGRRNAGVTCARSVKFLSTPSARRATLPGQCQAYPKAISIHALREEGDLPLQDAGPRSQSISIHALREEGDLPLSAGQSSASVFLSTPSARRATALQVHSVR